VASLLTAKLRCPVAVRARGTIRVPVAAGLMFILRHVVVVSLVALALCKYIVVNGMA